MTAGQDVWERIADALERIAPRATAATDWRAAPAYIWHGDRASAIDPLDALPLQTLRGIDGQKAAISANLARLATGAAAHDMLLWGARGMGKSALIRSCIADTQAQDPRAIALVQLGADALVQVPDLLAVLAAVDRAFLLFIDDLGFGADQKQEMLALRSLLDGGVIPRPARVRIAVTSNRRAIVARDADESEALHERDERDDALALADRFGLTLGFHPCDQQTYLEILHAYTDPLGLAVNPEEALAFAIARGNRSGRSARQFAVELAGRAGLPL